jgi:signal transduction histidine kinase
MDAERVQRLIDAGPSLVSELAADRIFERVLEAARDLTGAGSAEVRFGEEADADSGRAGRDSLAVPIRIRESVLGTLWVGDREAGPFTDEDRQSLSIISNWAGIAIDNAGRHAAISGQRDELARAVAGFEATTDLARALAGETRLPKVVELIVERGRALVAARSAVLLVPEGEHLVVLGAAGEQRNPVDQMRQPIQGSVPGDVLRTGRARRIDDIPRLGSPVGQAIGATAGIYFPLNFRGRAIGVLAAFDRDGGPEFTSEDERLLGGFSLSAAAALATAESVAALELRRSMEAAEHERRRWARELHDETLQQLGALRMLLSSGLQRRDEENLRKVVSDSIELIGDAVSELRRLITDLRPAALDQLGIGAALETLAERMRMTTALEVGLDIALAYERGERAARLHAVTENAVYRIVQEAINNVVKHTDARRVEVSVAEMEGRVMVTVRDDGRGFDVHAAHDGFGLVGMRERAALAGGSLVVRSDAREGTTVLASMPAWLAEDPPAPPVTAAVR